MSLPDKLSQGVIVSVRNRLTPETIRYRETYAHKRRLEAATQWEIANELGISQAAVSKILRRIDRRILRQLEADVQLLKVRQSRRLDELYQDAVYGWRESLGEERKTTSRSGILAERVESTRTQTGDTRFIFAALAVLESERRLWGLSGSAGHALRSGQHGRGSENRQSARTTTDSPDRAPGRTERGLWRKNSATDRSAGFRPGRAVGGDSRPPSKWGTFTSVGQENGVEAERQPIILLFITTRRRARRFDIYRSGTNGGDIR
jgi:predicted transcriptional regulator